MLSLISAFVFTVMTLNLYHSEYCQTSPNKNKSTKLLTSNKHLGLLYFCLDPCAIFCVLIKHVKAGHCNFLWHDHHQDLFLFPLFQNGEENPLYKVLIFSLYPRTTALLYLAIPLSLSLLSNQQSPLHDVY